jgi:hypothetical protein
LLFFSLRGGGGVIDPINANPFFARLDLVNDLLDGLGELRVVSLGCFAGWLLVFNLLTSNMSSNRVIYMQCSRHWVIDSGLW